jgi:hypothetical protein
MMMTPENLQMLSFGLAVLIAAICYLLVRQAGAALDD